VNIFKKIANWFRGGGVVLNKKRLGTPLDHPKINIPAEEYERIRDTYKFYSNQWEPIEYRNSDGVLQERDYLTLNMIKEVSDLLSKVVFNDKCKISISDKVANDFIAQVFEDIDFYKQFQRYLEPMFALGGLAARPYIENGKVRISWCLATTFYPLKSNTNHIDEGAIVTKSLAVEDDKVIYYSLIEIHERNGDDHSITNELYRSEKREEVGKQVPLNQIYKGMEAYAVVKNPKRPVFAYLKPAGFNNINPSSPLGLGVCDNAKSTLKAINDAYDSFNWEIQMGERTVIVPAHMTKGRLDKNGKLIPVFDPKTNVYLSLPTDDEGFAPVDVTSDIRTQAFVDSINFFLRTLEMQVKLSTGTFTFEKNSVKTATEVISEDSQTYKTRNSHLTEVETFIKHLIISILELAQRTNVKVKGKTGRLYNGKIPEFEEIGIDFDDGVFQSKDAMLDNYTKAVLNDLMPHTIAIARLNDLPEKEAIEWFKIIQQEKRGIYPDPEGTEL